jgi:hypothetical protein
MNWIQKHQSKQTQFTNVVMTLSEFKEKYRIIQAESDIDPNLMVKYEHDKDWSIEKRSDTCKPYVVLYKIKRIGCFNTLRYAKECVSLFKCGKVLGSEIGKWSKLFNEYYPKGLEWKTDWMIKKRNHKRPYILVTVGSGTCYGTFLTLKCAKRMAWLEENR